MKPFWSDLTWGTAATKHAASWPHVDHEGFGTVVIPVSGSKYWVVGKPHLQVRGSRDQDLGDMDTIDTFGLRYTGTPKPNKAHQRIWTPGKANTELLDYEGVLLMPGSVL